MVPNFWGAWGKGRDRFETCDWNLREGCFSVNTPPTHTRTRTPPTTHHAEERREIHNDDGRGPHCSVQPQKTQPYTFAG